MAATPTLELDACASREAMMRWLHYSYESHDAAMASFKAAGIGEAMLFPTYTPEDFQRRLQSKLATVIKGVRVVDLTAKVPTTPSGDLTHLVRLMHNCRLKSSSTTKVLFYFQRTRENSPAYVHLMAYGNNLTTPAVKGELPGPALDASYTGVAIFQQHEVTVPARLCISSAELMAEFVASMLDVQYNGFKCGECHQPFVRWQNYRGTNVRGLDELLLTDCDHIFHPGCVVNRFRSRRPNCHLCPVCAVPLPISAQPSEGAICLESGKPLSAETPISVAERAAVQKDPEQRFHAAARAEYNAHSLQRAGFATTLVPTRADETPETSDLYPAVQALLKMHGIEHGTDEWWCVRACYRKEGTDGIPRALNMELDKMKRLGNDFKFSERLKQLLCEDPEGMRVEVEALGMQVDTLLAAKHRDAVKRAH